MGVSDCQERFDRLLGQIMGHMRLIGLYTMPPGWRPSVATVVSVSLICFQPILVVNSILRYLDTMEILIECLTVTCTSTQVVTRTYFYFFQRDISRKVTEEMRQHPVLFGADRNVRMEELFSRSVDRMTFFYRLLYGLYLSSLTLILMPLVVPDPRKHNLPLAFQLPFLPPDENDLYYYVNYFYDIALNLMAIFHLAPIDGIIMLSMISASTMVDGLRVLLEDLDEQIVRAEWYQTEHLESALDHIIQLHGNVKRFTRLMYVSYRMHFFVVFGTICLVISMCLNVIVVTPRTSLLPMMVASVFELFVLCYFGSILLIANDALPASVYSISWHRLTIPQQKKLKFLLANTQPDIQMSAVFMPVNMTSFVTVVRAAYSYFALIN